MLRGIKVQGFSALASLAMGLTPKDLQEAQEPAGLSQSLLPLSLVIGRNDTGKTALFELIAFLRDIQLLGLPLAAAKPPREGFAKLLTRKEGKAATAMQIDLCFEMPAAKEQARFLHYHLHLQADSHQRPYIAVESLDLYRFGKEPVAPFRLLHQADGACHLAPLDGPSERFELSSKTHTALSLFGRLLRFPSCAWLSQEIRAWYVSRLPEEMRPSMQSKEPGGHRHLNERCDNVQNFLDYMKAESPARYQAMMRRIRKSLPAAKKIGDAFFDSQIRSGSLKLFVLFLLFEDERSLICLDEPDLGLYHEMLASMVFEMREYLLRRPKAQLILSSHHPLLVDACRPEEIWRFDREDTGDIRAERLSNDPMVSRFLDEGLSLGSLWYQGHLER